MTVEMAEAASARFARLREAGGARLDDPRAAAEALAADELARVRLAIFRALGDPTRFLIGELLRRHGPLATTELEVATGVASSTMSHHLRVLENARVVVPESAGGWTFWRLAAYPMVEVLVPSSPR
jgi:DNA-binding transcriptional ArsR family regulator